MSLGWGPTSLLTRLLPFVSQLALKHRQNKNQRQRVIAFVGSPLEADEKALVKLAKKMKKNNVAIDVVNFGEEAENTAKLEAFVNAVNSGDNSHLITIPPGPHILSDQLLSTPVFVGEDGTSSGFATGGGGGGGGGEYDFGVDPNTDPELALVCFCFLFFVFILLLLNTESPIFVP